MTSKKKRALIFFFKKHKEEVIEQSEDNFNFSSLVKERLLKAKPCLVKKQR